MRIGLIDVDSHAKKKKWGATIYPNLALCKIAAYHKANGDSVEWYDPMFGGWYDKAYVSKVFNFTPDYQYPINADEIVRGGTGYDITSQLPQDVDDMQPDYSIYPSVPTDISYGFLTRGCPNKCKWCVVPRKEGNILTYWDIERVANGRKKIVLMDNNILATGDYAKQQLQKIIDLDLRVDFNQAIDARLVTDEFASLLAQVKWLDNNRIRFGCDTHKQIEDCERAMEMITGYGFTGQYFLYTMLNDDFDECYDRINHWWLRMRKVREQHEGRQVYAYAQPFRDPDDPARPIPQWQKDMAGWVNKKAHFVAHSFEEFEPRKGFKCREYFNNKN